MVRLYIYTKLFVVNYCTMILYLLHVSAETVQLSSGRPLLQTEGACNLSLKGKNYVHVHML
jgi:hypothetical protein